MSYEYIKQIVNRFSYDLPIVASDRQGNQMVIHELTEDIKTDTGIKPIHVYSVYTYIDNDLVKLTKYYDNGMISEEYT